ncbi:hypothetical protein POM88_038547 [Heracleum sosnowskyi]|uniref:F-box domain-containing protein n=1 Tax=Heracleum sosnowskyi TaxID=360622 RepID=A0AAD8M6Z9_9APIA|nr:hypothetical protein POM88_038547 [Heracleum sosnowskyi]
MTCDHVRTRQFYARRAKTANARCQVCDIVDVSPKRRKLDSRRLVVSGGGGGDESDSKVLQLDDIDCISNLPQELIDCILKLLSVKDAARTSVLSEEWRYKWAMNPQLILDKSFFLRLTSKIRKRDKIARCSAFSRAIEKIILVHSGDILGISLYFPLKLDQCSATRWIEHFLNKGTRHLELNNYENHAYEIPSCLFDCVELINLLNLKLTLVDDGRRFNLLGFSTMAWEDMSLGLLRRVKIQGVVASYYVFYLIKFLLASSPSLEGMLLMCSGKVTNPREKLETKQELQNFPKRSSSARIVFRSYC